MLRSWRAEDYKRGERPILDELPVRLAYLESRDGSAPPAQARLSGLSPAAIIARAEQAGSPPADWLRFLAAQPPLLEAWSSFYWTIFDDGALPARLKHLVRLRMAQVLDCPEWAPAGSPRLAELGIGAAERAALVDGDEAGLTEQEKAALAYGEVLALGGTVDDQTFARLAACCTEAELVELGFAVASQSGVIRVYRWLRQVLPAAAERPA